MSGARRPLRRSSSVLLAARRRTRRNSHVWWLAGGTILVSVSGFFLARTASPPAGGRSSATGHRAAPSGSVRGEPDSRQTSDVARTARSREGEPDHGAGDSPGRSSTEHADAAGEGPARRETRHPVAPENRERQSRFQLPGEAPPVRTRKPSPGATPPRPARRQRDRSILEPWLEYLAQQLAMSREKFRWGDLKIQAASARGVRLDDGAFIPWERLTSRQIERILSRVPAPPERRLALSRAAVRYLLGERSAGARDLHRHISLHRGDGPAVFRTICEGIGAPVDTTAGLVFDQTSSTWITLGRRRALVVERDLGLLAAGRYEEACHAFHRLAAGGVATRGRAASRARSVFLSILKQLERRYPRRTIAAMVRLRSHLDEARRSALALVFDEKLYPYEPGGGGQKGQVDVDKRVKEVRRLWKLASPSLWVPESVARQGARGLLLLAMLEYLGAPLTEVESERTYLFSLASSGRYRPATLRVDEADQRLGVYNAKIDEENRKVRHRFRGSTWQLAERVNAYRVMMGLHPLRLDGKMVKAAEEHRLHMGRTRKFAHVIPGHPFGATPSDRVQKAGIVAEIVSENIAWGARSPADAHDGWYRSAGHHRGMLGPDYDVFGVAGAPGGYWVEVFALRS